MRINLDGASKRKFDGTLDRTFDRVCNGIINGACDGTPNEVFRAFFLMRHSMEHWMVSKETAMKQ